MNAQAHVSATMLQGLPASSKELLFLRAVDEELASVKESHPAWYADYEDIDPFTADRDLVEHLLQTAPDGYTRGLITGMLLIRQQIAAISGRGF
ncbi:hypothetical protein [Ramlibacter sp. AN1133]|uniref:hypothetical protein n=1 Tax=Ramlibacter sp. AN1133 TaxID=3133429 RepID=UPI0030C48EA1